MPIDFSKLVSSSVQSQIEPRDIFMSLPNKDKSYGYPRDVQTEVWKQWFALRSKKNLIIKMNTGSGKTVVGLTILQSCLNEGKGPAMYVVPDNYLVAQVCSEAEKLGIRVAADKRDGNGKRIEKGEDDYFFLNRKAILVTNIYSLVNGKSVFGMRSTGNISIGSIIIDDVHACLDIIEQQYCVRIQSDHELYRPIIELFKRYSEISDSQAYYDIAYNNRPGCNMLIPFWDWQDSCNEIYQLLSNKQYSQEAFSQFNMPLLKDNWKTCNCVISASAIEITPKCIPISKIKNFCEAERRIFMSATLADDSIFVSTMALDENEIKDIITPEKANDIGERLILFPKHLKSEFDDIRVKEQLLTYAERYNVVVIVPSFERAEFWRCTESTIPIQVLSSRNSTIEKGITALKEGTFLGLTVLVNKYDGIDLPDNACRFLVIDGLPAMRSQYDMVIQGINPNDKRICCESIQKIEQGMGRGVRSNNDYCVIVLMGCKLADVLINQGGDCFFSKATHAQYDMSKKMWEQLMEANPNPTIEDVFQLSNYALVRDKEWAFACKGVLSSVEYDKGMNIDRTTMAIRKAFDYEHIGRYDDAFRIIQEEKNSNLSLDAKSKGLLMQLMAEYKNFTNPQNAQEILLAAQQFNNSVLRPLAGMQYEKLISYPDSQEASMNRFFVNGKYSCNGFLIHVDAIKNDLVFSENTAEQFENAIKEVALLLGIQSSRPEKAGEKGGPDNLWAVGNGEYFVVECKNGVNINTRAISKADCSQLLSSIQWFKNRYSGHGFKCHPIMIHRVNVFDADASPDPLMRIMTEPLLLKFANAVNSFARSITNEPSIVANVVEIKKLLIHFKLYGKMIVDEYTVAPKSNL